MAVKRGLGKGLSALFSDTDAEYEFSALQNQANITEKALKKGDVLMMAADKIFANPNQPRKKFEADALNELTQSVREHGILQPLIVSERDGLYMIVAGERRYRAALNIGLDTIPVVIKDYTDKQIREISLIENLQREDLNPIESAMALKQLMEEYNLTQDDLARRIGKSRSAIANLLRLLSLPSFILDKIKDKKLTEGHARCLIGLSNADAHAIITEIENKDLSVRQTEFLVKALQNKAEKSKKAAKDTSSHSLELQDLIDDMKRVFGTKVSAVGSETRGRIYIDYYSADDLERIYELTNKLKKS